MGEQRTERDWITGEEGKRSHKRKENKMSPLKNINKWVKGTGKAKKKKKNHETKKESSHGKFKGII